MKSIAVLSLTMLAGLVAADLCAQRPLHQCELTPEEVEGPYFIPEHIPQRSNVTEDREGVPLAMDFVFQNAQNCVPIKGLIVHLWQADANGDYSGFTGFDLSQGKDERNPPIDARRYLRGYQVTDDKGQVHFDSIAPGWYPGRCVHVHVETFLTPELGGHNNTIHTTQGYFPDGFGEKLKPYHPYNVNPNRITPNNRDGVFRNEQGEKLIMDVKQVSDNIQKDGYRATMVLGIKLPKSEL